ncbi:CpaF family protein [Acidaminobacter sp. JC074]|uniref:ATPase, T2SS/T4P/T4SS family n=1 Tax=Acidaminobacter sp. JC074 TaxID=2530199 RepID=UPI001F0D1EE2|nr:ATPase, T2SS/T4P/T4SS family [Acidaminobacter sp. JC074]MCH4887363.1 CpaF family protein [Acidaminobacter sp. JC074]
MSLIKSHHTKLDFNNAYDRNISIDVIKEIVTFIINKHASLIVDIETKQASAELLNQEIVRYLDDSRQFQMNRDEVISEVMNYMFGYGILQKYVDDQEVTDIDVCRYDFVIIKKYGHKEIAPIQFADELEFTNFCKLIIIRNGGVINEYDSHARVADQTYRMRINVTISPRNVMGSSMTIRKHRLSPYDLTQLRNMKMFDLETEKLLRKLMVIPSRILIVGKGASGKTTLLRALLHEIPITERFLVCESDTELYPENPNFIVQKVKGLGKRQIALNELVRDGLTMSLDGYCIGELVGSEVNEFIKAGYTDHRILGTLHALGVKEAIPRMISMMDTHKKNIESFIGKSLDIIIYMKKFKIVEVAEVYYKEDICFNTLMKFDIKMETPSRLEGEFHHLSQLKASLKDEIGRRYL